MKALRFSFLFFCFFMDVHVRADECWGKSVPCAIAASTQRRILNVNEKGYFVLSPNAMIELREGSEIRLVRGSLYVEFSEPVTFLVPFGRVHCGSNCYARLERKESSLQVQVVRGSWNLLRLGDSTNYLVPEGMQLVLGEVMGDGLADMEFPQALPWESFIKSWAKLYPHSSHEFVDTVRKFRPVWEKAVESAVQIQSKEAGRAMASHEAVMARAEARRRAEANEDESLRKMFREKNGLQP